MSFCVYGWLVIERRMCVGFGGARVNLDVCRSKTNLSIVSGYLLGGFKTAYLIV